MLSEEQELKELKKEIEQNKNLKREIEQKLVKLNEEIEKEEKVKFRDLSFPLKCGAIYGILGFWLLVGYIVFLIFLSFIGI